MNFQNLNCDVLFCITKFLNIRDVCILRNTNKNIKYKLDLLQDYIFTNKSRFSNEYVINYIKHTLNFTFKTKNNLIPLIFFNNELKSICSNIDYYCKFDLLIIYNLMRIYNNDYKNISNLIEFIETLNHNKFKSTITNYYQFLINQFFDKISPIVLSLDNLYKMSKYVTNLHILKKLIDYKEMDLNSPLLLKNESDNYFISEIVEIKYAYNSHILSSNYIQISKLLFHNNLFDILINKENELINRNIIIFKFKYNSKKFNRFMKKTYFENTELYNKILNDIIIKKKYIKKKFLS